MNHHYEKIRQTQHHELMQLNVFCLATIGILLFKRCVERITKPGFSLFLGLIFVSTFLTSCGPQRKSTVFQHPMVGSTSGYHAMPVSSDNIKAATYADASCSLGQMGADMHDDIVSFRGSIHRAVLLNNVRLYAGGMLSVGNYNVKPYNYLDPGIASNSPDSQTLNRFFGSYGVFGGVSLSTRVGRRNEWRYIGIEGGIWREFGDYLSFRKSLPDSAYFVTDKRRVLGSLGLSTEIIFKRRTGFKSGLKFANGVYFRKSGLPETSPISLITNNSSSNNPLFYSAFTYHFTIRRSTAYFQVNIASRTGNLQMGYSYRF